MDLQTAIEELDKSQKQVVMHFYGPLIVIAGPGAGKTRVVVLRTANMIYNGIAPENILLFTFTKKASTEIKNRIANTIGNEAKRITVGTYHSVCNKILRNYAEYVGLTDKFSIYDKKDSVYVIKDILKSRKYDCSAEEVSNKISIYKRKIMTPAMAENKAENGIEKKYAEIYKLYSDKMLSLNAVDFDDLIYKTVKLLENNEQIKKEVNNKYKYIVADESHDSSILDLRLIYLLAGDLQNICMICDNDQCLLPDTKILTLNGEKNIKDITVGDKIVAASGGSKTSIASVEKVSCRDYIGTIIKATTKNGHAIEGTPNHITFASIKPSIKQQYFYVYLMYKHNYGFRIGRTSDIRSRGNNTFTNGFEVRLNQEGGDKLWILKKCNTLEESMYYESYYSYEYGIPQYVFKNRNYNGMLSQELIKELYSNIDTISRGLKLLDDKEMYFEYPHHIPGSRHGEENNRRKLNFTMFAAKRNDGKKYLHKLQSSSVNEEYAKEIEKYISYYKQTNKHATYYESVMCNLDYDKQWSILKTIEKEMLDKNENFSLSLRARLTNDKYDFTPLSNLIIGSTVCINKEGAIIEDEIVTIEKYDYEGKVYDINVPEYRNYIANNIVVHNSIYSFRGAEVEAMMHMKDVFKDTTVMQLDTNYRSTVTIVDASRSLIERNTKLIDKKLHSNNAVGNPIIYYSTQNEVQEGACIRSLIKMCTEKYEFQYNQIAVLYRNNNQAAHIEEALLKGKIPYTINKSLSFYDRAEIKDILSYFKIILNPWDMAAFIRLAKFLDGVGEKTLTTVYDCVNDKNCTILEACNMIFTGKTRQKYDKMLILLNELYDNLNLPPKQLIEMLLTKSEYLETIKIMKKKNDDYERIQENVKELCEIADSYSTIQELIENFSIEVEVKENDENKVKLMTMHSSKGLEWQIVIIAGAQEGLIPSGMCNTPKEIEEERRLMYVSMTRAQRLLFITMSKTSKINNKHMYNKPSRFINEIDPKFLHKKQF